MRISKTPHNFSVIVWVTVLIALAVTGTRFAEASDENPPSYAPVVVRESFETIMERMMTAKPEIMNRQMKLLAERYDLSDRPARGLTMSRGKAIQEGVRVKLRRRH